MLLRFIILFVFTLADCRNSPTLLSNVTDQQALLHVKASITGDPHVLSSWNHSVHVCFWEGITCSRRHQRVTALNLSSQQLDGTLSPHIGNLSFLRAIRLDANNFRGLIPAEIARISINVQRLGARADGKTDVSKVFLRAWNSACASRKPAQIYVPRGKYLIRYPIVFSGQNCKHSMSIRIEGTIVASTDYNLIGKHGYWIKFERVNGLSISGGKIDAKGAALWNCKKSGKNCPTGATSIGFYRSTNVVVSRLASINSQRFHMIVYKCRHVNLRGIKILALGSSPNTDGINVQLSSGVSILNSRISTGDDCVSVGPGTTNTWIENIFCGPGHGISIGSLGWDLQEPGVQNLTVKSVAFRNTDNGVRIKTWARSSNGFVRNVLFKNIVMSNVKNPVLIDQDYCPNNQNCPGKVSGVKISNVRYQNISGSSAKPVAVQFQCSKKYPCNGIRLQDVALTYKNQAAKASCAYAGGTASGLMKPSSCLL